MADARSIVRTLARSFSDVRKILCHANDLLRDDIDSDRFLTVFFGRLCPERRQFTYLNAGHPSGVLLDRDGQLAVELKATLPALGFFPLENVAAPITLTLEPGHLLMLLTDGVIETTSLSGEEFGRERAIEIVRTHRTQPAADIVKALYAAVRSFSQNQPQSDDITMVIIKVNG
jgi:sigma-B regulation protein RsbU (phosphoserine phosphatase)